MAATAAAAAVTNAELPIPAPPKVGLAVAVVISQFESTGNGYDDDYCLGSDGESRAEEGRKIN